MDKNQGLLNIGLISKSSSSSGNNQNNSKASENISKKSILRKEGSTSKNKDKHATFDDQLNTINFYLPDVKDYNKNHRISLNTVNEEAEPNSHSRSRNNNSSNKNIISSEIKNNMLNICKFSNYNKNIF